MKTKKKRNELSEYFDEARARKVLDAMESDTTHQDLADTFKAMGDPTRTKILAALGMEELCVGDLAAVVGLSPSAVSHQLRLLRHLKLVKFRREGKVYYYSLDDEHIRNLMIEGLRHVAEQAGDSGANKIE